MQLAKLLGVKGFFVILLLFALFAFAFQNMDTISVRFLFWDVIVIKKIYIVLISAGVGLLVGVVLGWKFKR